MNDGEDSAEQKSNGIGTSQWYGFVYMSDAVDNRYQQTGKIVPSKDVSEESLYSRSAPLSTVQVGRHVRIVSLNCGESNKRLTKMGLISDKVLEVISRTATGSVVVAIENCQVGLSAGIAQRIQVH